jgi:hypothetical protein
MGIKWIGTFCSRDSRATAMKKNDPWNTGKHVIAIVLKFLEVKNIGRKTEI